VVGAFDGLVDIGQAGGPEARDRLAGGRVQALVDVAAAQAPFARDVEG
jgi:hypothetical protein